MEIASKERMITYALVGLCAVIGVMAFLAVVYYGQATDLQTNINTQTAALQAEIDDLQAQIANAGTQKTSLETQVADLENEIADLNGQIQVLSGDKTALLAEVDGLKNTMGHIDAVIEALTWPEGKLSNHYMLR